MSDYYIFGAHSRARTLYQYYRAIRPCDRLLAFLYDDDEDNASELDGVPVLCHVRFILPYVV